MEKLNDLDRKSDCWDKVTAQIELRIKALRSKNDKVGIPEHEANAYRGAILEFKNLLKWGEPDDRGG